MTTSTRPVACASLVIALGVVVVTIGLSAQVDPFMGSWRLNVAKSSFSPGPAPKSGGVTFTATGSGFKAVITGIGTKDEKGQWEYSGNYDGKDYPLKGNPDGDMISVRRLNPNTVETTIKRAGKPVATNTRTVSADGKTMTVTTKGTNAQGQTVHNVQVFEKS